MDIFSVLFVVLLDDIAVGDALPFAVVYLLPTYCLERNPSVNMRLVYPPVAVESRLFFQFGCFPSWLSLRGIRQVVWQVVWQVIWQVFLRVVLRVVWHMLCLVPRPGVFPTGGDKFHMAMRRVCMYAAGV